MLGSSPVRGGGVPQRIYKGSKGLGLFCGWGVSFSIFFGGGGGGRRLRVPVRVPLKGSYEAQGT